MRTPDCGWHLCLRFGNFWLFRRLYRNRRQAEFSKPKFGAIRRDKSIFKALWRVLKRLGQSASGQSLQNRRFYFPEAFACRRISLFRSNNGTQNKAIGGHRHSSTNRNIFSKPFYPHRTSRAAFSGTRPQALG